jgi:hypothetical protein
MVGTHVTWAYAEMSAKTRCRSNSLPTTITATLFPFGAAEREGLSAKKRLLQGGLRPTRLIGATPEIGEEERTLSTFYANDDESHDLPTSRAASRIHDAKRKQT